MQVTARRVLAAADIDDDLGIVRREYGVAESAKFLRQGLIDAFFWVGGLSTSALTDLASETPIRMLPVDRYVDELRTQYGSFYQLATIPSSTYTGVPDIRTIAVPSYLLVSSRLSDELVFRLTSALFTHRTRIATVVPSGRVLDLRSAISTASIPLHPGAARYYRSVKP